jgi:predicted ATPase
MRVLSLHIHDFKNLHEVTVNFDDDSPVEDSVTSVILGRNGTGKSNLLEALILIFRDLDLNRPPHFAYAMTYLCRGSEISLDADPERPKREQVRVNVDGDTLSYANFQRDAREKYLPSYVFGYYSGPSNRMEMHFDLHQKRFYDTLIDEISGTRPLRPLLYARLVHSQFALLAFFNEQDPYILEFLDKELGIESLESVLFVMRKPSWTSREGNPLFWNARGEVRRFLEKLYELAFVPLRLPRRVQVGFKGTTNIEHLYLYLKNIDDLKELSSIYDSQQDFFKALESTYISEILSEVRIRVRVRKADGSLTFRDLSEGEQQLLMVLGLLRFTQEDEALFLLDEPDTHLNPIWGIQYLEFINRVAGTQRSHVIMATHNPLVISSLRREQVRILQRDEQTRQITIEQPYESPQGMGVAAILTSDLFGLRSTLDIPTQQLMDERRELAAQDAQNRLDAQKQARLLELNEQLRGVDFSISTLPDPLYHDFVLEMTRMQQEDVKESPALTPQQREEQRALTRQILQKLREKKEQSE